VTVRPGDLLVRFEIRPTAGAPSQSRHRAGAGASRNAKAAATRLRDCSSVASRPVRKEDAERELRVANAALAQAQSASGAAKCARGLNRRAATCGCRRQAISQSRDLVDQDRAIRFFA
jgi:hypothetical protein